jgi:hypothetical protein
MEGTGSILVSLLLGIGLLVVALVIGIRFLLPRDVRNEVAAEVIHDGLQGIWRSIFGPRKVRVVRDRKRHHRPTRKADGLAKGAMKKRQIKC